ncbi:MAG: dihydrodipicolinate synthase family protein [Planctomycetota bacterium]|jgi:N-acetylneuraminate lyase
MYFDAENTSQIKGIIPAVITPFSKGVKDIDYNLLSEYVDFLIGAGSEGLFVGGSTGEGLLQSVEERKAFLDNVNKVNAGRVPVISHVGAVNINDAYELAEYSAMPEIAAVSSVTPIYYEYSFADIIKYYQKLGELSGKPLIIYYVPACTSKEISEKEFLSAINEIPEVMGIKYTHSNLYQMQMIKDLSEKAVNIYGGFDQLGASFLAMGAGGLIGATFSMLPEVYVALYKAFTVGEFQKSFEIQKKLNSVLYQIKKAAGGTYHEIVKLRGIDVGYSRRNNTVLNSADQDSIKKSINDLLKSLTSN